MGLVLEISKGWCSAAAVVVVARASEKCDFGWRTNEDTDLLHIEAELGVKKRERFLHQQQDRNAKHPQDATSND